MNNAVVFFPTSNTAIGQLLNNQSNLVWYMLVFFIITTLCLGPRSQI